MLPLSISWRTADKLVYGPNYATGSVQTGDTHLGVVTWHETSSPLEVTLRNTSQDRQTVLGLANPGESLKNIRLYLTGDAATIHVLMVEWPPLGCGVELSMDQGASWILFSGVSVTLPDGTVLPVAGYDADPTSWIPLRGSSVSSTAGDGELLPYPPYDQASLLLRVQTPSASSQKGLFQYEIGLDFDVF